MLLGLTVQPSRLVATQANVLIPSVGCNADGQVGPLDAPKSTEVEVRLDPAVALRLALYRSESTPSVLGPRGWSCFGVYGSARATLYVTPEPLGPAGFDPKGQGNGIEASAINGDTSGRFEVARIVARVFPAQRAFVERVIAEGIEPARNFPSGPFPGDYLKYLNDLVVEYETSADSEGLGTSLQMRPGTNPIRGITILQMPNPTLLHLALRLPQSMKDLEPIIILQFQATD